MIYYRYNLLKLATVSVANLVIPVEKDTHIQIKREIGALLTKLAD